MKRGYSFSLPSSPNDIKFSIISRLDTCTLITSSVLSFSTFYWHVILFHSSLPSSHRSAKSCNLVPAGNLNFSYLSN